MNPHIGDIEKHFKPFINVHNMSEEPKPVRTEHRVLTLPKRKSQLKGKSQITKGCDEIEQGSCWELLHWYAICVGDETTWEKHHNTDSQSPQAIILFIEI